MRSGRNRDVLLKKSFQVSDCACCAQVTQALYVQMLYDALFVRSSRKIAGKMLERPKSEFSQLFGWRRGVGRGAKQAVSMSGSLLSFASASCQQVDRKRGQWGIAARRDTEQRPP